MKKFLICIVLGSLLIVSCQKIFFNEEEGTREISLEDFHDVKISGIFNLVLVQDSTDKLVITGKNDIGSVDAITVNDTLIIDDHKKRSFNPDKNSLVLHFTHIEQLELFDPVRLTNRDTIKAENFRFFAIGEIAEVKIVIKCNSLLLATNSNTLGYIYFNGIADNCWIWNRYGSCIYADSLQCNDATIYNESVGDVNINAADNINAFIRGPGNIGYYGNPVITISEKRGTGKLIRLD
jgi:hypothetical protein